MSSAKLEDLFGRLEHLNETGEIGAALSSARDMACLLEQGAHLHYAEGYLDPDRIDMAAQVR